MQLDDFKYGIEEGEDVFYCTFGVRFDKEQFGRLLKHLKAGDVGIKELEDSICGDKNDI